MFDLLIHNAKVLTIDGETVDSDVVCHNGRIEKIADRVDANATEIIDADGHLLMPGVIDPQVHFREPGAPHKEDINSGSRAAVRGGVTSFLEMPNCNPPTIGQEQLNWKIARASHSSFANFGFFIGATKENLKELNDANPVCGIKIFMGSSTGNLLVDDQQILDKIFSTGARLIAVHAEDESRIQKRHAQLTQNTSADIPYERHSEIRDAKTALIATQRAVDLSNKYGRRLHILHLSTAEEVNFLRNNKSAHISCEVVPNHLFLSTDDYASLGAKAQMNPPLRDVNNSQHLWRGLYDNVIDIIATDHAPHTVDEKSKPYPNSPSGTPGVETSLPLMLTAMVAGQCTLKQIQEWMCTGPAKVYGIQKKGLLTEGYDADLALVDIRAFQTVKDSEVFSRAGWSPFAGMRLTGWPIYTIVNGRVVFDHGVIREGVFGQPLSFHGSDIHD
ncbi:MAG: dihydroorotase [Acidiferrobacteraceae bacterium]|nr:dihydroorotase [Acidiferrobacteraceae bacterium]